MIVDTTFFYGELSIPQITEGSVAAAVNQYINKYEPLYLQNLLGYELYKDFAANQSSSIYVDIIGGKEYTSTNGLLRKWNGLKVQVIVGPPARYRGPIANYVWYHWVKDHQSFLTATGEKAIESGTEVLVSPWRRMVAAWNEMVNQNCELVYFLEANPTVYPLFSRNGIDQDIVRWKNPLF